MLGIDVSNYSGPLTDRQCIDLKALGYEHVIVQSLDDARFTTYTRQQLQKLAEHGIATDVYVYPFTGNGRNDAIRRLSEVNGLEHLVGRVWLDAEDVEGAWSPAARESAIMGWLEELDAWSAAFGKPRTAIYCAWWYCRDWLKYSRGQVAPFSDRDLWDANYDYQPDASVFYPYCGFQRAAIKQYAGDASLAGIPKIDLNAISPEEEQRIRGEVPEQPPEQPEQPEHDPVWQAKKWAVVSTLGYVAGDLTDALLKEAHRRYGPRRAEVDRLARHLREITRQQL